MRLTLPSRLRQYLKVDVVYCMPGCCNNGLQVGESWLRTLRLRRNAHAGASDKLWLESLNFSMTRANV